MAKKTTATKVAKKVSAPKPAKEAKPLKEKIVLAEAKVRFVSFAVRAVIPTQQYGNIQPEITVEATTYEEAREFVMPFIEELYKTYAEEPLNGRKPAFLGKIVETEKVVTPATQEAPKAAQAPAKTATAPTAPEVAVVKPEAVLKAEKAIGLAMTDDAAQIIQTQIENSVKIPDEFKPDLIQKVLEKRSSFK